AGSVPLANATFAVEDKGREVTSFTTDDKGHFQAALPPGHYKVSLKGRKSSIGRFGPFEADVVQGKMTNVQWECDSGIRKIGSPLRLRRGLAALSTGAFPLAVWQMARPH